MLLDKKADTYKQLVEKLSERCRKIQAENERCVIRVNSLKKILRRRTYDVDLLKRRLDKHGDKWRLIPMVLPHFKGKTEQKRGPKPKNKNPGTANAECGELSATLTTRKPRKQRVKKHLQEAATTTQTHTIAL